MSKTPYSDTKEQVLRQHGTLNPSPARVREELFREQDFFDPRDLLQVKYEMLRRVDIDGHPVRDSAEAFGFSRSSFYKAQADFAQGGLPGLIPQRRGPKAGHKLTPEVMEFIQRAVAEDDSLRARALARLVEDRFGVRVHRRSIERALAGREKKGP